MKTVILSAMLLVTGIVTASFLTSAVVAKNLTKVDNIGTFRVHRQGKDIVLNWSGVGSNVASFVAERSWDGEYYDPISDPIPNTQSRSFKFTDENVPPGYLYYRVVCYNAEGQECGSSAVEMIRIVQRK